MEQLIVNKTAQQQRLEDEYKKVVEIAKRETANGFRSFDITITAEWMEIHGITDRLKKEFGVKVCDGGLRHNNRHGSESSALVKFYVD